MKTMKHVIIKASAPLLKSEAGCVFGQESAIEGGSYQEENKKGFCMADDSIASKDKHERPEMHKVILLNDNFTTKEFVVAILMLFFHKDREDANRIMETVHREGQGCVGEYPYDIAATKCAQVRSAAKNQGFPLRCMME